MAWKKMRNIVISSALLGMLAACGGGGGSSEEPDTTPMISSQPQPTSAALGAKALLQVRATGGGLRYQWQQANGVNGAFRDISGATSSDLYLTTQIAHEGARFRAIVSNSSGSATSDEVSVRLDFSTTSLAQDAPALSWTAPGTASRISLRPNDVGGSSWWFPSGQDTLDSVLADDGSALIRWAATTENTPALSPHREVFVARTASGQWHAAEQFDVDLDLPTLVMGASGKVSMLVAGHGASGSTPLMASSRTYSIGANTGSRLLAADRITLPTYAQNTRLLVAADGTQHLYWNETSSTGFNGYLQRITGDGSTSAPSLVLQASSQDESLPILSQGQWRNDDATLPLVWQKLNGSIVDVLIAPLAPRLASSYAASKVADRSFAGCMETKAYHAGGLTVALWGERIAVDGISRCHLHVTVLDQRHLFHVVYDKVLTSDWEEVLRAWASLDEQGNLAVFWDRHNHVPTNTGGAPTMHFRTTVVPDPGLSRDRSPLTWSETQNLVDDTGRVITPLRRTYEPALTVGPAGHIAVAFNRNNVFFVKLYTPGSGWSEDKPFALGAIAHWSDTKSFALNRHGHVLVSYISHSVKTPGSGEFHPQRLHLMSTVLN